MSNPSLILPQSPAYGEDYVYAAQVEDGAVPLYNVLPLTFTRASGGTRINKDGLVQNMPYNLLQYSETFDNGYWNKYQSSISSNVIANPINGQTTADQLTYTTTGTAVLYTTSTALQNQVYALSCYGKKGSANILQIGFTLSGGDKIANYNLNTGVITTTSSGVTASIESIGNGWYRCTMSLTPDLNNPNVFINSTSATTGDYLYIFGAQLNIGSTAQPYLATTDRLNMPRITYPVGGGCGALLLEKQSTNVFTYSEQFDNADWFKEAITLTANATTSPDGTQNADTLTPTTANGVHRIEQDKATASQVFTQSIFAKANGYNFIALENGGEIAYFNLSTGVVGTVSAGTASIQNMGNGWYRCIFTATALNSKSYFYVASVDNSISFAGNGTSGIYVWGAQFEASSYATSYIPTTSTSATRIADACYKTGISNLIGQSEGTIYGELEKVNGAESILAWLRTGATLYNEMIAIYIQSNGVGTVSVRSSATNQFAVNSSVLSSGSHKFALAYKANDFAFYIDGVQIATSSSGSVPTCDQLYLAGYPDGGIRTSITNEVILYKTRLTNAELATLTTL